MKVANECIDENSDNVQALFRAPEHLTLSSAGARSRDADVT